MHLPVNVGKYGPQDTDFFCYILLGCSRHKIFSTIIRYCTRYVKKRSINFYSAVIQ